MGSEVKAAILFGGVVSFFLLMIAGPLVENTASSIFKSSADYLTGESQAKSAKTHEYQATALAKVVTCCNEACGMSWDYQLDRCDVVSELGNACMRACSTAQPAQKKKKTPHHG